MDKDEIDRIVDNIDPIDWEQMRLTASLTPGQRIMVMAEASAFSRALLRGALPSPFPRPPHRRDQHVDVPLPEQPAGVHS